MKKEVVVNYLEVLLPDLSGETEEFVDLRRIS
jgi:hypothetical protein